MYIEVMAADGKLRAYTDMLQGEEMIREYRAGYIGNSLPVWLNKTLSWVRTYCYIDYW
jgi:hypothetical protein